MLSYLLFDLGSKIIKTELHMKTATLLWSKTDCAVTYFILCPCTSHSVHFDKYLHVPMQVSGT